MHVPPVADRITPSRLSDLLISRSWSLASSDVVGTLLVYPPGSSTAVVELGSALVVAVASVVRGHRLEARWSAPVGAYRLILPDAVARWLFDPRFLWSLLSARYGSPRISPVARDEQPRRISAGEIISAVTDSRGGLRGWTVRIEGGVSFLVVAPELGRDLAAGLDRLRGLVETATGKPSTVKVREQEFSRLDVTARFLRIGTQPWTVYWPEGMYQRFLSWFAGTPAEATAVLMNAEFRAYGLVRLLLSLPRSAGELRARGALRTMSALLDAGGTAARVFAELAYTSGEAYRAMSAALPWLPETAREQLRRTLGRRRWEQVWDHAQRGISGGTAATPWGTLVEATEFLIGRLADRCRSPGRRPPEAALALVRRYYLEPRDDRLGRVWRRQIDAGELAAAVEEVLLSRLKQILPRLPRRVLLLAVAEESSEVQRKVSAVFSRSGRRMFHEDLLALERAIGRGELRDWHEILAARQRLVSVIKPRRNAPARGRGRG